MRDMKSNVKMLVAMKPQAMSGTTDITGETIDLQGYDSCVFALLTDAIAASSLSALLIIQESDTTTDGDFSAVADADLIGLESETEITQATDTAAKKIGYKGAKRYVRMKLDIVSNNGTDVVAGVAVLGHAETKPVA